VSGAKRPAVKVEPVSSTDLISANGEMMNAIAGSSGRIVGFDLLRGLCAIAVAYYHILAWTGRAELYNFGRYGVYIFFVLSGASMYVAYSRKFDNGYRADKFILLRIVRIAPLYALIVLAYTALLVVGSKSIWSQVTPIFLNISLVFGMGNPALTSPVTGGWSLGIEFLFYLMFPVLLALTKSRAWLFVLGLSFIAQHMFIGLTLANGRTLETGWVPYTQMLSFLFYFVAGCSIGRMVEAGAIRQGARYIVLVAVALGPLVLFHTEEDLTGIIGWTLSICTVLATAGAAGIGFNRIGTVISEYFGKMSYGVYLIHPLVYAVVRKLVPTSTGWPILLATSVVLCSIGLALLVENRFETPVRNLIKRRLASAPKTYAAIA
jgi:peptidoglycan/LPS O-acetylase OafA/YrhL